MRLLTPFRLGASGLACEPTHRTVGHPESEVQGWSRRSPSRPVTDRKSKRACTWLGRPERVTLNGARRSGQGPRQGADGPRSQCKRELCQAMGRDFGAQQGQAPRRGRLHPLAQAPGGGYHCTCWSKTHWGCGWARASQSGTASRTHAFCPATAPFSTSHRSGTRLKVPRTSHVEPCT